MHFLYFQARISAQGHFTRALRALLLLIAPLLISSAAWAQFRGSIQGTVTDTSGGVIPGAKVTLTNLQTNETNTTTSNNMGLYNFSALPSSTFKIEVEKDGFQTKVLNDVHIIPEQPNSIDVKMEVGQVAQTVTVNAATAPLLDSSTATIGGTISENQIQHMPSFGRDVFQLASLAPGSTGDQSQAAGGGTNSLPGTQGPGGEPRCTAPFLV